MYLHKVILSHPDDLGHDTIPDLERMIRFINKAAEDFTGGVAGPATRRFVLCNLEGVGCVYHGLPLATGNP